MHPIRKRKLMRYLVSLLMVALLLSMVLYALRQNISLFYTPSDIQAQLAPEGQKIRMGGKVVQGSIQHDEDLWVHFKLTDLRAEIPVAYQGVLPDLFRDEQGVVVEGYWTPEQFKASRVLAKHDENYMPPEVHYAIEKASS